MTRALKILVAAGSSILLSTAAWATLNYFQGFEVNTGDWTVDLGIARVPSGGGTLAVPSSSGSYHAEIQNLDNAYQPNGFGEAGYSFYGGADSVYHGDFYQAIDIYVQADWLPPTGYPSLPAFWIDMTPYHAAPSNYGAEHNFRLTATGGAVDVRVDGQSAPIATLTASGWYTFEMTWRRAPVLTDPVVTDMHVYDSTHALLGTTSVSATSPGGPFASSDLRGNGYVWITVWQNGFGGNVLAMDNQRTGLLGTVTTKDQCKAGGWASVIRADGTSFKNQGDCIQYVNTGK